MQSRRRCEAHDQLRTCDIRRSFVAGRDGRNVRGDPRDVVGACVRSYDGSNGACAFDSSSSRTERRTTGVCFVSMHVTTSDRAREDDRRGSSRTPVERAKRNDGVMRVVGFLRRDGRSARSSATRGDVFNVHVARDGRSRRNV